LATNFAELFADNTAKIGNSWNIWVMANTWWRLIKATKKQILLWPIFRGSNNFIFLLDFRGIRGIVNHKPKYKTMTLTGTCHFATKSRAISYHLDYFPGATRREVRDEIDGMIERGEIAIGRPETKDGETLKLNSEGRYVIVSAQ
jgi:hypothetical protein